jgi:putative transposase
MRGKAIVEATFSAINTLWCQHLPGYTGRDVTRRGKRPEAEAAWSVPELQDLLDEWVVACFTDQRVRFAPLTCCYS